ncbi:RDD family protein [Luteimonas sp. e5]
MHTADSAPRPRPLLGWRLLAMVYDFFPLLGIWFVIASLATALHGGDAVPSNTLASWLTFAALVAASGLYATASWRRGGQTIGMKPWRLYVEDTGGGSAPWGRLWLRYAVGILSLACAGLGFAWALIEGKGRTWHDLASGTRMVRDPDRDALHAARR